MEPSPRVRRRCWGGVVWEKVSSLVCSGCGKGSWTAGVGWVVMGMRMSVYPTRLNQMSVNRFTWPVPREPGKKKQRKKRERNIESEG